MQSVLFAEPVRKAPLFFLGTHQPHWLQATDVPLFVSARRLRQRCPRKPARAKWACDSGGFSELSMFGAWQTTAEQYAREVVEWSARLGGMSWAAIQDWMCEPWILAKTGLDIATHQARSVFSYLRLTDLAPNVPWAPVLQGWHPDDYLRHADAYQAAGVALESLPIVGLGSVCRRQSTNAGASLVSRLSHLGLKLHGFGFKTTGLAAVGHLLESADSMAWSSAARMVAPMDGHTHKTCANCLPFALRWRERITGPTP